MKILAGVLVGILLRSGVMDSGKDFEMDFLGDGFEHVLLLEMIWITCSCLRWFGSPLA